MSRTHSSSIDSNPPSSPSSRSPSRRKSFSSQTSPLLPRTQQPPTGPSSSRWYHSIAVPNEQGTSMAFKNWLFVPDEQASANATQAGTPVHKLDHSDSFDGTDDVNNKGDHHSDTDSHDAEAARVEREHASHGDPGALRVEALNRVWKRWSLPYWALLGSLFALCSAITLQGSTISNYQPKVTAEYANHAGLLGVITIATSVINAVSKPFISKICDISSRHMAYLITLGFFVIGIVVCAASRTGTGYAVGSVIQEVGDAGLDLVCNILAADMSNLQWRGLVTAAVDSPYIVFAWVGANVAGDILDSGNWRWGYGMYAIMMPALVLPLCGVLYVADRKARKMGEISINASSYQGRLAAGQETAKLSYFQLLWNFCIRADIPGLLVLAFGFCLLFLPFSLYKKAQGQWSNPSMIAMLVVGPVFIILFILYEIYLAPFPLMNSRIARNKVFWLGVTIDVFYFASGNLRSLYFSSYVLVVKPWTTTQWSYFTNTSTVGLCVFGLMAGLIQRYTHKYKMLQIFGLCVRIIAMGITYWARGENANTTALVFTQILNSLGGAMSVVGTRVATQASVPHADLAQVIALLALYTKLGGSVGSAIAAAIWTGRMENNLIKHGFTPARAKQIYDKFTIVSRTYAHGSVERNNIVAAADDTLEPIFIAALVLSFVPLLAGIYMPDWRLDNRHNKVERIDVSGTYVHGSDADSVEYRPDQHGLGVADLNPNNIQHESENPQHQKRQAEEASVQQRQH
ncbi:unnamed protein product [Sympodiomycopsis kandeliae]